MKAESQQAYMDMVHREIKNTRQILEDMGVKVEDVLIKRQHDRYEMDLFEEDPFLHERTPGIRYDVRYNVTMSQRWATDMITIVEDKDRLESELSDIKKTLEYFQKEHLKFNMKRTDLARVLDGNPGIKDQWDEIMTMLKMAGFDEDILKD